LEQQKNLVAKNTAMIENQRRHLRFVDKFIVRSANSIEFFVVAEFGPFFGVNDF
jgi:hypothetical protein